MSNHRSTTTQTIGIRLTNEQIAVIDKLTGLGDFDNRSDCIRAMLMPQLVQFVTAVETKSATKAAFARMKEERIFQKRVGEAMRNSEIQDTLDLELEGISFAAIPNF